MPSGRPAVHRLRERALDLVAVLGTLSLLCAVALAVTDASLVVFRTGSMSPTMPVGALAVVVPMAADRVVVGDVVTVTRADRPLPVTHRVVSVNADPSLGEGGAVLRLRGDANAVADPQPYEVTTVARVLASAPHAGHVLERVRTPPVLATATAAAAGLVAWAFWPPGRDRRGTGWSPRPRARHRS